MLDNYNLCVLGSKTSMASVTIEEKRLKALKQQLFGKEQPVFENKAKVTVSDLNITSGKTPAVTAHSSLTLKNDLLKIASFSAIALLIQFALFFAGKNGLIRFI